MFLEPGNCISQFGFQDAGVNKGAAFVPLNEKW